MKEMENLTFSDIFYIEEELSKKAKILLKKQINVLSDSIYDSNYLGNELFKETSILLYDFCINRLFSVLLLVENHCPWDAEIILRSGTESLVKFLYICLCEDDDRKIRLKEYWDDQIVVNSKRQALKATDCMNIMPNSSYGAEAFDKIIIENNKVTSKNLKNRKELKSISQKWSFHEMVENIDLYFSKKKNQKNIFKAFLYSYGISSNLIHADETGIGIINERYNRNKLEHILLHKSHCCRIISDTLSYLGFVSIGLKESIDIENIITEQIGNIFNEIAGELSDHQKDFQKL